MAKKLPEKLLPRSVSEGIKLFEAGRVAHGFKASEKFDVLGEGNRYPPKAIAALATREQEGWLPKPADFSAGAGSKCFRLLREAGFRVVPKPGVNPFKVGSKYTRKEVGQNIGTNDDMSGGAWATGYRQYSDVEAGIEGWFFLFANVGDSGRTGHDFDNNWLNESDFSWQAKGPTTVEQPQIQKMLGGKFPVLLFTRDDSRSPFTYHGEVSKVSHEETTPVAVVWRAGDVMTGGQLGSNKDIEHGDLSFAGENKRAETNQRVGHAKFAKSVLANFENRCCVTGISERELLVASHIVPWSENTESRLDPANGLCLSAMVDRLFDRGFISFTDDLEIIVKSGDYSNGLRQLLDKLEGVKAQSPVATHVSTAYLAEHRKANGF